MWIPLAILRAALGMTNQDFGVFEGGKNLSIVDLARRKICLQMLLQT